MENEAEDDINEDLRDSGMGLVNEIESVEKAVRILWWWAEGGGM